MQLRQFHGNCTWFFSHIFSEMLHWLMMEVLFSEEIETIIYLNNQLIFLQTIGIFHMKIHFQDQQPSILALYRAVKP